ncbi:carbonic anhydrase [Nostoc sp. WHI]|uniref:carbonic anhydrase n=1 Tax=Nostoc sp. WHI TaxID=2650611 RepID=UPI0018C4CF93|nr:carbonic anhydrase [Nostoc sp. WHI]MBG1270919.1 carbonic anhydrase [Nostoc sp. WHI]
MSIKGLIKGLREFRQNYFCTHQELFQRLSHYQAPEVLFISCCDSRIDPNLLTQTQPGELFILRNIGNIIPPYGITQSSEGAAIEYAVQALKVKDIIICGHSDCGAMKGLLQLGKLSEQMPLVYDWLKHHGQATRRLVEDNYKDCSGESLLRVTIEENILTQIQNLETYPVIRSKLRAGELYLHAWVYEIEIGRVFAYNASLGQFVPIENLSPVPNPLPLTNIHA